MNAWPAIETLVPHTGPMLLIDTVLSHAPDRVSVEVVIRKSQLFFRPGFGVPAYVGLEMMAQAVCAWDSLKRRHGGQAPAMGFLLGCRRYKTARPHFRERECLRIEAISLMGGAAMGSFECRILDESGLELASGVISAYRPTDLGADVGGLTGVNAGTQTGVQTGTQTGVQT